MSVTTFPAPTLAAQHEDWKVEIRLTIVDAGVIWSTSRLADRPFGMRPTTLILYYRWDPEKTQWRALWILKGRRVLKSGNLSDKEAGSMHDTDFDVIPGWISNAVLAHHPEKRTP